MNAIQFNRNPLALWQLDLFPGHHVVKIDIRCYSLWIAHVCVPRCVCVYIDTFTHTYIHSLWCIHNMSLWRDLLKYIYRIEKCPDKKVRPKICSVKHLLGTVSLLWHYFYICYRIDSSIQFHWNPYSIHSIPLKPIKHPFNSIETLKDSIETLEDSIK